MSVADLQLFSSERFGRLRATQIDCEVWFAATDVAKALGYRDANQITRALDDDEKRWSEGTLSECTHSHLGIRLINESGLYRVLMRSQRPEAIPFQRWLAHEVVPEIRRNGGYIATSPEDSDADIMARALLIAQKTIDRKNELIALHEATIEDMKPKALFADAVADSDGTCLIGELAKMMCQNGLEIGQNRLFKLLQRDGYLGKSGSNRNVPTQRSMDMKLFRIKETAVTHSDGRVTINRTPKVTGKGQAYFIGRYCGAVSDGL
ncbi:MAG: phage antirepressor KilAC domain-containing protein [Collinsella sp.]|nr:phage antirepressor KilAC domain-containing protein [Collinsella sp.]